MESIGSTWFRWLLWLLGFDFGRIPSDARAVEFTWLNMPTSWGVFVLIAVVLAFGFGVFYFYIREIDTCPRRMKLILAGVRFAVLFLLVIVFLSPALTYKQERTREPYVVVMRDASQSMNTKDRYLDDGAAQVVATASGQSIEALRDNKPTRTELLNDLLARKNYEFVRLMQERGKVRFMDFAEQVEKVGTLPAKFDDTKSTDDESGDKGKGQPEEVLPSSVVRPLDATGRGTNLWLAIKEAISINPLAAIVIFTDGQHTAGDNPVEIAEQAKEKGVKLFMVGMGDPTRARNLEFVRRKVEVREKVWPNEPFEISAVLDAVGTEQREVTVDLFLHTVADSAAEPGPGTRVDQKKVTIPEGGGRMRVAFDHIVAEAGFYSFSMKVDALDDERALDDNEAKSSVVEAVKEKSRVLLIAGAPTWEYRMVQRLFQRDASITVSCWLQTLDDERTQEGNVRIDRLPSTMAELGQYSVVMMFDPNPDEFDAAWIDLLKDFSAKHAGGVLYMAGPKYSGSFLGNDARTGKMKDILPVRFGDVEFSEVQGLLGSNRRPSDLRLVLENIDHPIMSFYQDPQKNRARWETLPGIFWSFPSVGPKPTAKVLVEHSDQSLGTRPLLVAGRYGAAHTVYIGFNGTWRWRRVGRQAEFFDKYWIQVVRYLIETRSLTGKGRGYVEPEQGAYDIGDKVVLAANLKDATFEPLTLSQVEATLRNGDGESSTVVFKKIDDQPGLYEASFTARQAGEYALDLELAGSEGSEVTKLATNFRVQMPSIETNHVWLNEKLLRETALASGGNYYGIDQLNELAADITDARERIEVPGKPVLLWSEHQIPYRILFLLVVLLTAEWAFRKGFKLL